MKSDYQPRLDRTSSSILSLPHPTTLIINAKSAGTQGSVVKTSVLGFFLPALSGAPWVIELLLVQRRQQQLKQRSMWRSSERKRRLFVYRALPKMGGHPLINLASHRKDDKYYNKKKRELRKYLPLLREHLSKMGKIKPHGLRVQCCLAHQAWWMCDLTKWRSGLRCFYSESGFLLLLGECRLIMITLHLWGPLLKHDEMNYDERASLKVITPTKKLYEALHVQNNRPFWFNLNVVSGKVCSAVRHINNAGYGYISDYNAFSTLSSHWTISSFQTQLVNQKP